MLSHFIFVQLSFCSHILSLTQHAVMRTRSHASEMDATREKDPRAKVPKGKETENNRGKEPPASMLFSFSGPPPSIVVLKNMVEMDIVEFTPLQINSNSRISMPLYNLCVQM